MGIDPWTDAEARNRIRTGGGGHFRQQGKGFFQGISQLLSGGCVELVVIPQRGNKSAAILTHQFEHSTTCRSNDRQAAGHGLQHNRGAGIHVFRMDENMVRGVKRHGIGLGESGNPMHMLLNFSPGDLVLEIKLPVWPLEASSNRESGIDSLSAQDGQHVEDMDNAIPGAVRASGQKSERVVGGAEPRGLEFFNINRIEENLGGGRLSARLRPRHCKSGASESMECVPKCSKSWLLIPDGYAALSTILDPGLRRDDDLGSVAR